MSDFNEVLIKKGDISAFQESITHAINKPYSYAVNSNFALFGSKYYQDYFNRYVKVAIQWLDGYVPHFHNLGSGIISTRIGTSLVNGLTRNIVGERLTFREKSKDTTKESIDFISKKSEDNNYFKAIKTAIGWSIACGTSVIKLNARFDDLTGREVWFEPVRLDHCFYRTNAFNDVEEITFFLKSYQDTRKGCEDTNFFIVENRYYKLSNGKIDSKGNVIERKGEKIPYVRYLVNRCRGTSLSENFAKSEGLNWSELPSWLKNIIIRDYSAIKINEELRCPFDDLGVQVLQCEGQDLSVPNGQFGKSMLIDVQTEMIIYELANSYEIRDMYLGKGKLYTPRELNQVDLVDGVNNIYNNSYDNTSIEILKGVNPETQKAIVEQFALRGSEWELIKADALRNIATKWNTSPKMLSAYLNGAGNQKTATEVYSDDDATLAFINSLRAVYRSAINKLIDTALNFYGKPVDVKCDFASPSLVNKERILDRVTKEYEAGFIDLEEAITQLNPDMTESEITDKVARAEKRQKAIQEQQMSVVDEMGDFNV